MMYRVEEDNQCPCPAGHTISLQAKVTLAFLATWAHAGWCSAAVHQPPQVLFCWAVFHSPCTTTSWAASRAAWPAKPAPLLCLEFCIQLWSPQHQKDVDPQRKSRRGTKMIQGLKHLHIREVSREPSSTRESRFLHQHRAIEQPAVVLSQKRRD